jgi:hypothetical protein
MSPMPSHRLFISTLQQRNYRRAEHTPPRPMISCVDRDPTEPTSTAILRPCNARCGPWRYLAVEPPDVNRTLSPNNALDDSRTR